MVGCDDTKIHLDYSLPKFWNPQINNSKEQGGEGYGKKGTNP